MKATFMSHTKKSDLTDLLPVFMFNMAEQLESVRQLSCFPQDTRDAFTSQQEPFCDDECFDKGSFPPSVKDTKMGEAQVKPLYEAYL